MQYLNKHQFYLNNICSKRINLFFIDSLDNQITKVITEIYYKYNTYAVHSIISPQTQEAQLNRIHKDLKLYHFLRKRKKISG